MSSFLIENSIITLLIKKKYKHNCLKTGIERSANRLVKMIKTFILLYHSQVQNKQKKHIPALM